ncbi:lipase maturation factor 2-like isoform X2 [Pomacea canaliculata]|uniref:lipase maturation factor 2-like isoform X2 n=1 Tax=Pomacea canaliculata TaxID=400727 RepID=UPI000D727428|nr:lipase maturation factor 2-like isoform X2 [Pomacea canaliculata]
MASIAFTRDLYLWFMSVIYLFAFSSLYVQIPGLYGNNGIMPARFVQEKEAVSQTELMNEPTLLKLTPKLGLDTETAMDLLCLGGILISFFCVVCHTARDFISFTFLWVLYLSLYKVGQTFMWFQWDILLLEAGFLTMLVAPFGLPFLHLRGLLPHDNITFWLVRWLLFRLMFASGVVKLTSYCPTWWGLTALTVHFESQCIPTPLAWYWHHFPEWFLRVSCVATYVIEIALPFLFFVPIRALRMFSFFWQVVLQVLIILTGNYNFFNLLTIALCISILDDKCFSRASEDANKKPGSIFRLVGFGISVLATGLVLGIGAHYTVKLFSLEHNPDFTIKSQIAFTEKQFHDWLEMIMPWTMRLGAASLAFEIFKAINMSRKLKSGWVMKGLSQFQIMFFGIIAAAMFSISLVDLTVVDRTAYFSLPQTIHDLHTKTEPFQITNSYGLFRKMTGVGGRPEVIVEGSYEANRGWKEYNFLYKPGDVSARPPIVAPHQPRLDWQMWFAALGNYQNHRWFVTLLYRLLTAQPEVLELMGDNPFPEKPPNYVRALLYHYHYTPSTPLNSSQKKDWWERTLKAEYIPVLAKNDSNLLEFLRHNRILEEPPPSETTPLSKAVKWIRQLIGQPEGFRFVMSLFTSAVLLRHLTAFLPV